MGRSVHGPCDDIAETIMSAVVDSNWLQLREMCESDIGRVMEVEKLAYEFPWREQIFRDCCQENYICKVYELGTEVLGYGIASIGAGECHILNICIHPELQRRGLATGMLKSIAQDCQYRGVEMIFLEVRVSNTQAQALYNKAGFNQIGMRSGYYPASNGREDAIVFAKDLSQVLVEYAC
jgi:ribosomal-protein-alanine N-acetyltransferase